MNSPGLVQCHNLQPTEAGLENLVGPTNPFGTQIGATMDWPFPVLSKSSLGNVLYGRRRIYDIDSYWTLSEQFLATRDPLGRWQVADFGPYQLVFGGNLTLMRRTDLSYKETNLVDLPNCGTGCAVRGQLLLGDISEGENWVQWSEIGSTVFDIGRSNVAGTYRLPFDGPVWRLVPIEGLLGARAFGAVAYGQRGIEYLMAVDQPAPTYSPETLAEYGIASRNAVGVGKREHLFVDERGYLRHLGGKGLTKLDYQEFFEPMLGSEIVIVRDELEDEWWLSDGTASYMLSEHGLCSSDFVVADGYADRGIFVAMHNRPTVSEAYFMTDSFDMELKVRKSIETLMLSVDTDGLVEATVFWRNIVTQAYVEGPTVPIVSGVGYPKTTGIDFRIRVRFSGYTYVRLHDMQVRWKLTDKTAIRGKYAPD